MTPFEEADARLAGMHGYAAAGREPMAERLERIDMMVGPMGLIGAFERLEAKVNGLETLVRELMVALRGGAVGKWA